VSFQDPSTTPRQRDPEDWGTFASYVAEIAGVEPSGVRREMRLVDDLNLDSLGVTELVVLLLADFELEGLSQRLVNADWTVVTVGDIYDEYSEGHRGTKRHFHMERPE
jgi:acyl carrier protein